tara:strand:- start:232 stop:456 length:225 start_codon:yes stop_codon:yes gene_type:complete
MNNRMSMFLMLDRVNKSLNTKLDLNNAPIYGGWQLTNKEGSHIIKHRVPVKEMLSFLDGMSKALEIKENAHDYY